MCTLERAIALAAQGHAGQVDKAGEPYILHPLRVMMRVSTTEERIVAVIHDLLEDSAISTNDMVREGFSNTIIKAALALTRQEDESYNDFARRAAKNSIACKVKLADLEDNLDLSRIPAPTEKDFARIQKYRRAMRIIKAQCD